MAHALSICKIATRIAADVCDEILKFAIAEVSQCIPRLTLQLNTAGALRIVNLHDSRRSIAELCEVQLADRGTHIADRIPTAHADRGTNDPPFAKRPQKIAPAGFLSRSLGAILNRSFPRASWFGFVFLSFHLAPQSLV